MSAGRVAGTLANATHDRLNPRSLARAWLGETMPNAAALNSDLFERGAPFTGPTLWLHSDRDAYYFINHSSGCFDTFVSAGGRGAFHEINTPESRDGHQLVFTPSVWEKAEDEFLVGVG